MSSADTSHDRDGWQYGVRFADGSVAHRWNGHSQRWQAQRYLDRLAATYPGDAIGLVRRQRGGDWQRTDDA